MSSLASKLLAFSSPYSPLFSSSRLRSAFSPRSTSLPFQRRSCRLSLVRAQESDTGDSSPPDGNSPKSRRDILLEYVKTVQPEFMKLFMERAPKQVVDAMRQTVANMIGTLPPQFFQVTITTARNAQYRLELQQSLEQVVIFEKKDNMELTNTAGEDVIFPMNAFIKRLLAVSDPAQMKIQVTQTTTVELTNILYWLMVVGYSIRNIEVRFDMEGVLDSPSKQLSYRLGGHLKSRNRKFRQYSGTNSIPVEECCHQLTFSR